MAQVQACFGLFSSHSKDESIANVGNLCRAGKRAGYQSLGLFDVMNFDGLGDFLLTCRQEEITGITGLTVRLAPIPDEGFVWRLSQMPIIITGEKGWKRANQLLTQSQKAQDDNSNQHPTHVTYEQLLAEPAGLRFILGTQGSDVYRFIQSGMIEKARSVFELILDSVKSEKVSIGLPLPITDEQFKVHNQLRDFAEEYDLQTIIFPTVRCSLPEDDAAWRMWKSRHKIEEPSAHTLSEYLLPVDEREHIRPAQEIDKFFADNMPAIVYTNELAEEISFTIEQNENVFPKGEFERGVDADSFVWNESFSEAQERYQGLPYQWREKLNSEFEVLRDHGIAHGFIWILKLLSEFDESGIYYGPGLGNLSNSLVCSLLSITRVDPFFLGTASQKLPEIGTEIEIKVAPQYIKHAQTTLEKCFSDFAFRVSERTTVSLEDAVKEAGKKLGLSKEMQTRMMHSRHWNVYATRDRLAPTGQDPLSEWRFNDPRTLVWLTHRIFGLEKTKASESPVYGFMQSPSGLPLYQTNKGRVCPWNDETLSKMGIGLIRLTPDPALDVLAHATQWIRSQGDIEFTPEQILQKNPESIWKAFDTEIVRGIPHLDYPGLRRELAAQKPKSLNQVVTILEAWQKVMNKESSSPSLVEDILTSILILGIKIHYPLVYFASALSAYRLDKPKFQQLLNEVIQREIKVQPIDINCSAPTWSPEGDALRPGLCQVHSLTQDAIDEIEVVRQELAFSGVGEFIRRVDKDYVTNGMIEDLICAGTFDGFGFPRRMMLKDCHRLIPVLRPKLMDKSSTKLQNFFDSESVAEISDNVQVLDLSAQKQSDEDDVDWIVEQEQRTMDCLLSVSQHYYYLDYLEDAELNTQLPKKIKGNPVLSFIGPIVAHDPSKGQGTETFFFEIGSTLVRAPGAVFDQVETRAKTGDAVIVTGKYQIINGEQFIDFIRMDEPAVAFRDSMLSEHLVLRPFDLDVSRAKKLLQILKRFPGPTDVSWPMGEVKPPRVISKINQRKVCFCPALTEEIRTLYTDDEWEIRMTRSSDTSNQKLRESA